MVRIPYDNYIISWHSILWLSYDDSYCIANTEIIARLCCNLPRIYDALEYYHKPTVLNSNISDFSFARFLFFYTASSRPFRTMLFSFFFYFHVLSYFFLSFCPFFYSFSLPFCPFFTLFFPSFLSLHFFSSLSFFTPFILPFLSLLSFPSFSIPKFVLYSFFPSFLFFSLPFLFPCPFFTIFILHFCPFFTLIFPFLFYSYVLLVATFFYKSPVSLSWLIWTYSILSALDWFGLIKLCTLGLYY